MSLARAIFDDLTVLADATRARLLLLIERHELTVSDLRRAARQPSRCRRAPSDGG